jgi:hypothetical protein
MWAGVRLAYTVHHRIYDRIDVVFTSRAFHRKADDQRQQKYWNDPDHDQEAKVFLCQVFTIGDTRISRKRPHPANLDPEPPNTNDRFVALGIILGYDLRITAFCCR